MSRLAVHCQSHLSSKEKNDCAFKTHFKIRRMLVVVSNQLAVQVNSCVLCTSRRVMHSFSDVAKVLRIFPCRLRCVPLDHSSHTSPHVLDPRTVAFCSFFDFSSSHDLRPSVPVSFASSECCRSAGPDSKNLWRQKPPTCPVSSASSVHPPSMQSVSAHLQICVATSMSGSSSVNIGSLTVSPQRHQTAAIVIPSRVLARSATNAV